MGRVIRIGFLGAKAGRQHHWTSPPAEDREEDPRERAEGRTRWSGKPQGDMPAGATSL